MGYIPLAVPLILELPELQYIILYSTVLFPWWSFRKINGKEDDKKENDKEDDEGNGEYRRIRGTSIAI